MKKEVLIKALRWFFGLRRVTEVLTEFSVTVVIPAYNEEKYIARTIQSITNQTYPVERLIVVDDCSSDRTGEIAQEEGAEVVRTPQNTGTKSQAINFVLDKVASEIMVTVDADTCLDAKAIEAILPAFADPKIVAACGFVLPQRIQTIWERSRFIEYLHGITLHKGAQANIGVLIVASGCFSAFRTATLKQCGGFPERTLAEDMDLTWELLLSGKKVALMPEALCFPADPHNYATYKAQVDRWYRSFLQNINVHKRQLLKNKRLLFFVAWYLLEGLIAPLVLLSGLLLAWYSLWSLVVLGLAILSVSTVSLWKGLRLGKLQLVLKSLPCYFVIRPVNHWRFLRAIWYEWIRRERLSVWEKGHS